MQTLLMAKEGLRYGISSAKRKLFGNRKFYGDAQQICKQIVNACWNGKYYENSLGNYREFWTRDFGISTESLLKLGKRKEARSTLLYALEKFSRTGIKTAINRDGNPFSFPNIYSPDSAALLFHSLAAADAKELAKQHKNFLEKEAAKFAETVVDETGQLRKQQFSGMRDHAIRDRSCYDAAMAGIMKKALQELKLENPLKNFNAKKLLMEYWTGTHFIPDKSGARHTTADANIFPFYLDFPKSMQKKAFEMIENDLAKPLPLAYSSVLEEPMRKYEMLVPGWERNKIWTNIAFVYLQMLKKIIPEKAETHVTRWKKLVEKHGTVFELYNQDLTPYKSTFYYADEGMLWSANFIS